MLLIKRSLVGMLKRPFALLSGLGMSLFFLLVYQAGIGGIGYLPEFGGGGYLAFLVPMSLVSLAMGSAAGAAPSLHGDMSSGYFRRLFLSPQPRWSFVAAPVIADGVSTLIGAGAVLAVVALFGVPFRFGLLSAAGLLLISLLWALCLSFLSAGVMLRTGSAEGARLVTTAVFPLIFLSTTFLPRELITAEWLRAVSWANPVTYMMEAMRYLLAGTADRSFLFSGLSLTGAGALLTGIFAFSGRKKILV